MTSQNLDYYIQVLKSKASLFHHCSVTVFVKRSCVTKHTPKALQIDKICSMTSEKLENDNEEPKSKAQKRAQINDMTVVSLSHHC
jgi:hypothetical protein